MKFARSVAVAAAVAVMPGWAVAQEPATVAVEIMQALRRLALQYTVLVTRSFVELSYQSVAIEPGTGDLVVTGLRFYPEMDWDAERRCEITIDRLVMAEKNTLDMLGSTTELSGLTIPPSCFQPDAAATLAGFGYEGLTIDSAAVDFTYYLPDSSADLLVQASVAAAADLSLSAHFDYLWFRIPVPEDTAIEPADAAPVPVARLGAAELVVENHGLWEAIEPMLAEQLGDLGAIPQMVQQGLSEALSEGGTRTLSEAETAFVDNMAGQVGRFLEEKDRIAITVAPEGGSVLLTGEMFDSPEALITALAPVVSAVPRAYREMIEPAALIQALAGGDGLDEATRLKIGEALITGVGAPRAVDAGLTLLAPLAGEWDGRAALLSARAGQARDPQAAYALALRAMAGAETAAIPLADELEGVLPLVAVLAAQADAAEDWPGAADAVAESDRLVAEGDISGMRRRAFAAAAGRERPRDYAGAYYWASLAAAAGDRGAASLRERLDARFAGQEGWSAATASAAAAALDTWTTGGLAETLAARVR